MSRDSHEPQQVTPATRQIRLARRIWLQDGATPVFGVGIRELLIRVEATGSLHMAAAEMGLAYSKAWRIVGRAEEHLGFPLMTRHAGGTRGGGSALSMEGRRLVDAFGRVLEDADAMLDELAATHLDGVISGGLMLRARTPSPESGGFET